MSCPVALESARALHRLGWRVVPVQYRGKRPAWPENPHGIDWPNFRVADADLSRYFDRATNIGVILGDTSGGLADVDLDCPEALALADEWLPPTWSFGRASTPRAHRLYVAPGALSIEDLEDIDGKKLLELRANPSGNQGHQTVFPGSVHQSGEAIEWSPDDCDATDMPLTIDSGELASRVRCLAAATLLVRHVGGEGERLFKATGDLSGVPAAVAERVRRWLRLQLPVEAKPVVAKSTGAPNIFERVNAAGWRTVADALGIPYHPKQGLEVCPGCGATARSSHDRRKPGGLVVRSREGGTELWVHGKCGAAGNAAQLAAWFLVGTIHPNHDEWRKVAASLRERGL